MMAKATTNSSPAPAHSSTHFEKVSLGTREVSVKRAATPPMPARPSVSVCFRNSKRPEFASIVSLSGDGGGAPAPFDIAASDGPTGTTVGALPATDVLEGEGPPDRLLLLFRLVTGLRLFPEVLQKCRHQLDDPPPKGASVRG